ncbi:hypothetical protein GALMADRAFT_146787 [Galerina marginata CBS 339.88]|uniref:Uncharacterized protein n=1 Tax=Galerina marginata (strain CBS 339.88) TaxID=685588 RepID=A0A067SA35_GALM3|nr:hypothetical protein GALMADRAFT_146787 [Galerina marginata CBS 339.88]
MPIPYDPDTKYPLPTNGPSPLVVHVIFPENNPLVGQIRAPCLSQLRLKPNGLIQKPPGQVGCLSRGGYRLKDVLSWDPEIYSGLQSFLHTRIRHYMVEGHLARGSSITNQPLDVILRIQDEAQEEYPILAEYQDGWPSRDMMSTYLSKAPCIHHRKKRPSWVLQ